MNTIYTFLVFLASYILKLVAPFNSKLKLFVNGRKGVFQTLKNSVPTDKSLIWIHAASLGEYEQGLPILEKLKEQHPNFSFMVTFFSPSGYEVKKHSKEADIICYLPLDTPKNAKRFISITKPKLAIFIKYEVWPNYLKQLNKVSIPVLLTSALFSKKQIYFKPYGQFLRKSLARFNQIFVQNQASQELLNSIGLTNSIISGDTRFDRVSKIVSQNNHLDFMKTFTDNHCCFIAGSTWPDDETTIIPLINSQENLKTVIAPHNIKPSHIAELQKAITKKTVLFSELENCDLKTVEVLILDTIGLLTKVYSYADIAYVGGGFKTGLHNTLEPAVFGIPVIVGPHYSGFVEAEELVELGGILSITSANSFKTIMNDFINSETERKRVGELNLEYIINKKGATSTILKEIESLI